MEKQESIKDINTVGDDMDFGVEDLDLQVGDRPAVDEDQLMENLPRISSADVALRNSLKLMDGKYGGSFNVRYVQDDVQKYGWLELLIAYPDGSVKNVLLFKNAFRQTDIDSNGVYRNTSKYSYINGDKDCDFSFVDFYSAPDMPIPGRVLWNRIQENYARIPIVKIQRTRPLEAVYLELELLAATCAAGLGLEFMDTETCFYVTAKDFKKAAERSGWRQSDLCMEFDKAGLFLKDKTGGYQKSKKVAGKHLHFYVLKKSIENEKIEPQTLEDVEFKTTEKTQVDRKAEEYERKISELREKIKVAHTEGRPPKDEDVLL